MEFKGTKGKWIIQNQPYENKKGSMVGSFDILSNDNQDEKVVEVMAYGFWEQTFEKSKANALLISKAPEMLEFIKHVRDCMPENSNLQNKAKNLIKEATEL